MPSKYFRIGKIALLIFGGWFLLHCLYAVADGLYDKRGSADVAVVLGNTVNEDGSLSQRLKARVDKSIELYRARRVKKIIVSGGFGKEGFWEGSKMREYLIENNIPTEDIFVDDDGFNTEKTAINAIEIMKREKLKSAISVSQYFHQTRIKMLFRKHGFSNISSASPRYFEWRDPYAVFREFVAFYVELIRPLPQKSFQVTKMTNSADKSTFTTQVATSDND